MCFALYYIIFLFRIIILGIEDAQNIMPSSGARESKDHKYVDGINESRKRTSRKNSKFMDLNKVPLPYPYLTVQFLC